MCTQASSRLAHGLRIALLVAAGATARAQVYRETDLGIQQDEQFAARLANIGDVDGDGVDDFIVGAPTYSSTTSFQGGRVVVYSGRTGVEVREHDGTGWLTCFGWSVAGAGDVDGDGVPDYVVGAPLDSNGPSFSGMAVVYSGSTGSVIWTVTGATASGYLGESVAGLGDLDGDGKSEVLVGSQNAEAFVYDSNGNELYHLTHGTSFGASVAGCGDVDGDGVPDFVVGEPLANSKVPLLYDCGDVRVYSGANGALLDDSFGTNAGDKLGQTLARLGDQDGDGVDDFIAGGWESDANGTDAGIVRVVSGRTRATIREQTGIFPGDQFGFAVTGLGDVDLDGIPDYAVGAPGAGIGSTGTIRVCSGADGGTIYVQTGFSANVELGEAVAGGDWNGDGVCDLLAGDGEELDANGVSVGGVLVVLMCPAWSASYGSGWPGKNGVPTLTAQEKPVVGHALDVDLSNSLGTTTTALLFVGLRTANVPTHAGGTLLVNPSLSLLLPVPAGGATLSGALPNDPALWFLDIYLQAIELDSFASKGLSFTAGLQLHCGFDLP